MNPSQFFLSPVNLGGLVILILLELWATTVGEVTGVFRLTPSGSYEDCPLSVASPHYNRAHHSGF